MDYILKLNIIKATGLDTIKNLEGLKCNLIFLLSCQKNYNKLSTNNLNQ